ncbi:MAG: helix-turn-helix domain-containing protein [Patescibacteria group bacterium]
METQGLEKLGLTKNESRVYLAILRGGRLNLAGISSATRINRTTLYAYLENLLEKNYIKKTVLGKRLYYLAENPKSLVTKYHSAAFEFEKNLEALTVVFSSVKQTPSITLYQDKDGLQDLYTEIVQKAGYIKSIFSPDKYLEVFAAKEDRFVERVKEKGIDAKVLIERTELGVKRRKYKGSENYRYRFLEKGYTPAINMIVFNGHVALISFENLFGVLIANDMIAEYHEDIFDKEWRSLK